MKWLTVRLYMIDKVDDLDLKKINSIIFEIAHKLECHLKKTTSLFRKAKLPKISYLTESKRIQKINFKLDGVPKEKTMKKIGDVINKTLAKEKQIENVTFYFQWFP